MTTCDMLSGLMVNEDSEMQSCTAVTANAAVNASNQPRNRLWNMGSRLVQSFDRRRLQRLPTQGIRGDRTGSIHTHSPYSKHASITQKGKSSRRIAPEKLAALVCSSILCSIIVCGGEGGGGGRTREQQWTTLLLTNCGQDNLSTP